MESRVEILCNCLTIVFLLASNGNSVVDSCGKLEFAPNNFINIDETAQPGTHIFSIQTKNQETWTATLDRSQNIDGSLWRDLQSYFNFKKFGNEYEMIVDKTPDLERIHLQYSVLLQTLQFSMTCSRPGVPDQTTDLLLVIQPVNEYAPQFIGVPLRQKVPENTPIGTRVYSMENVTIDRDVNPSNKEISVFRVHKYLGNPQDLPSTRLDSLAYFSMSNLQKGIITVRENLDFEALDAIGATEFLLNVSAADVHGSISFTTLRIDIVDVNDLPPEFLHPSCPLHIQRSRPCPVSFLARIAPGYQGPIRDIIPAPIQARDMDAIGANITLSLDKGPGELSENSDRFAIDNKTGVVTVLSPFPDPIEVDLVVVAREESALRRTTQAPLRVSIIANVDGTPTTTLDRLGNHTGSTHTTNKNDNHNTGSTGASVNGGGGGGGHEDTVIGGGTGDGGDGGDGGGMDNQRIFLIIIGLLSSLVLILVVVCMYILCSIKKDQRSKVVPSVHPNNFTFSDHPSSYHRSLDGTSLDLTHDDFDVASEKNTFFNSKSRSSVMSHKNPRRMGNSRLGQSVSGYEFSTPDSAKESNYYYNHFRGHSLSEKNERKALHGVPENGEICGKPDVIYQDNMCCMSLGTGKLFNKQTLGRSASSVGKVNNQDRLALHSRFSLRSKSSSLQNASQSSHAGSGFEHGNSLATNPSQADPFASSSRAPGQAPLSADSTEMRSSTRSQSRKKRRSSSKSSSHNQREEGSENHGTESGDTPSSQSGNVLEKQDGESNSIKQEDNQQSSPVRQRRIRIPSGVLVMTEHVDPVSQEKPDNVNENSVYNNNNDQYNDDLDEEGDDESDIIINDNAIATDDESSSCFDSFTPTTTPAQEYFHSGKQRVSFQLDSHNDVLSVMPVELSSCQSSDEMAERPGRQSQMDVKLQRDFRNDNTESPESQDVNNLHVPECCNTPLCDLHESEMNEEKLFEKVKAGEMKGSHNSCEDVLQRHPLKPRRLPGLNIPGRKSASEINPGMTKIKEEDRPHSDTKTEERRLGEISEATQTECGREIDGLSSAATSTGSTAATSATSVIRKKKRRRRELGEVRLNKADPEDIDPEK